MAKVFTYFFILSGISLLLSFSGIQTATTLLLSSTGLIDSPEQFTATSQFFSFFYNHGTLLGVAFLGAAIFLSYISKQPIESFFKIALAGSLLLFIGDFVSILIYAKDLTNDALFSWIYYIIALIMIPLIIGYCISIVEWWIGTD